MLTLPLYSYFLIIYYAIISLSLDEVESNFFNKIYLILNKNYFLKY